MRQKSRCWHEYSLWCLPELQDCLVRLGLRIKALLADFRTSMARFLSGEASSGAAVGHELRLLTLNFVVAVSMQTSAWILGSPRLLGGVSSVNQHDVRITRRKYSVSMATALNNPFEALSDVCFLKWLCANIKQRLSRQRDCIKERYMSAVMCSFLPKMPDESTFIRFRTQSVIPRIERHENGGIYWSHLCRPHVAMKMALYWN